MEITIKATPKEVADLVVQLQNEQTIDIRYEQKNLLGEALTECLNEEINRIKEAKNGIWKATIYVIQGRRKTLQKD